MSSARSRIPPGRRSSRVPSLTVVLLCLILAVFATELSLHDGGSVSKFWFVTQPQLTPGLILGVFAHQSLSQLGINVVGVALFGTLAERRLGRRKFAQFVLMSAFIPAYLQVSYTWFGSDGPGYIGFSGATLGLMALSLLVRGHEVATRATILTDQQWLRLLFTVETVVFLMLLSLPPVPLISVSGGVAEVANAAGWAIGMIAGVTWIQTTD